MSDLKNVNDFVSRSWFAVFNNPAEHGYTEEPKELCERLRDEWIKDSSTRCGAWAYCISEKGLHHVHMVLEDSKVMRWSTIKKEYCIGMHFEPTKGTKKQATDYIEKRGSFQEKGEEIVCIIYHGDIQGRQGKRTDLDVYFERLESGETPRDILRDTPRAYCHINVLKNMYFDLRSECIPTVRSVRVYWHVGKTGTGKSYDRVQLIDNVGEDSIYYLTAFNTGAFDRYNGEPVLWIEDFRGEFKLQEMLRLLDCYKAELPARYSNVKALWNEVHITSVLTPRECYYNAVTDDVDRIEQLLRRITSIVYHFKDDTDYYKLYFDSYTLRCEMEEKSFQFLKLVSEFVPIGNE